MGFRVYGDLGFGFMTDMSGKFREISCDSQVKDVQRWLRHPKSCSGGCFGFGIECRS